MESILPCPENLSSPDPSVYLPHRNPFLFLDRVLTREPGMAASGIKCVTSEPGGYSQVFLLESMAQLGGIAAATREGEGGFLAAVDRAEFFRLVEPGDRILVTVRIVKSFGRLFLMEGEASVEGERVASAALTLGVGML